MPFNVSGFELFWKRIKLTQTVKEANTKEVWIEKLKT